MGNSQSDTCWNELESRLDKIVLEVLENPNDLTKTFLGSSMYAIYEEMANDSLTMSWSGLTTSQKRAFIMVGMMAIRATMRAYEPLHERVRQLIQTLDDQKRLYGHTPCRGCDQDGDSGCPESSCP